MENSEGAGVLKPQVTLAIINDFTRAHAHLERNENTSTQSPPTLRANTPARRNLKKAGGALLKSN
jgi:ethanolamine ammonia-lyase small subunit